MPTSGARPRELFPREHEAAIKEFNDLSELACDAGRALVTARVMKDPEGQRAVIPQKYPKPMRTMLAWLTSIGVAYLNQVFRLGEAFRGA